MATSKERLLGEMDRERLLLETALGTASDVLAHRLRKSITGLKVLRLEVERDSYHDFKSGHPFPKPILAIALKDLDLPDLSRRVIEGEFDEGEEEFEEWWLGSRSAFDKMIAEQNLIPTVPSDVNFMEVYRDLPDLEEDEDEEDQGD